MKSSIAPARPRSARAHPRPPAKWRRTAVVIALIGVTVMIGLDFVAAPLLRSALNRKLDSMPGYTGHVDGARVSLARGRVKLLNLVFAQRGHEADPPLAHVPSAELNLSYAALLHGVLKAEVNVEDPEFTVVKAADSASHLPAGKSDGAGKKPENSPAETEAKIARWQDTLRQTFPLEIEALNIEGGTIRLVDHTHQPPVDLALNQLHLSATNLRTRPTTDTGTLPAAIDLEAVTTGEGRLKIHVTVDPFSARPRFDSQFELRALSLPALNPFLLAYANADVARGTFEFDSEIHAAGGHYQGYVKPFFKDLDFKTASDKDKNAIQLLTKKAISAVATVLKNDDEKKVATKAPFEGDLVATDVDVWTTVTNLLRNAFAQGIREGFDGETPSR